MDDEFHSFSDDKRIVNYEFQPTRPEEETPTTLRDCDNSSNSRPKRQWNITIYTATKHRWQNLPVTSWALGVKTHAINALINSLIRGLWLTDEHIDYSQYLLSSINTSISGFQSSLIFNTNEYSLIGTPNNPFIEIVHYAGNHWICLSTVGCKSGEVNIYDSLYTGQSNKLLKQQVS